jgi:phosphonate transport system substrate-binding protein
MVLLLAACGAQPTAAPPATVTVAETSAPPATTTVAETGGAIVLGDISDEPAKKIKQFQPLADHLAAQLGEFGIEAGEVKIAPDMETMAKWMAAGEIDLYFDSPYPALIVSEQSGGHPILRRWKDGNEKYHTLFFAKSASGLTSVADLKGKMIVLEDRFSTSGYLLPVSYLLEAGLKPMEKDFPEAAVGADEVGYVFAGEDQNIIQWVISDKVAVGALDNETYAAEIPEATRAQLTILGETEEMPRQLVIIRPGVEPTLEAAIKAQLLGMDETEEGRAALEEFDTTQFDEFPEGADKALARMKELYTLVQGK